MTRVAISGHRGLPPATERLVEQALRAELADNGQPLTGISCLADGADQLFARVVLDLGGAIEVVIPAAEYRDRLPEAAHAGYDALLARASAVHRCDFDESTSESHMAASEHMLTTADRLIAVWDGQPARGFGGTADVVDAARSRGLPVTVIWPDGAVRD